jgi:hypothetical protein
MRRIVALSFALLACTPPKNELFHDGKALGKVDPRLIEASGLAASIANPGMLWTLNDGGNAAEVFLIDAAAEIRLTCTLSGLKNRDWEDVVLGPGPDSSKNYIYVADIGDNEAKYPVKILYRFEEPVLAGGKLEIQDFDTLYLKLDDGVRDTEAIMIDPLAHGMYLLSKREDSVHFYKVNYRVTLPFHNITAAEISPDGSEVVIKDYDNIYYWQRPDGGPISKLLQAPPILLPYAKELQGESITFSRDGSGYFTLSESREDEPAELIFYQRK